MLCDVSASLVTYPLGSNPTRPLAGNCIHGWWKTLEPKWQQQWRDEKVQIDNFVAGLAKVQRLLAHILYDL